MNTTLPPNSTPKAKPKMVPAPATGPVGGLNVTGATTTPVQVLEGTEPATTKPATTRAAGPDPARRNVQ